MWEWVIAVPVMLVTMGFGRWLQRREARYIAHMINEGNKRLELILSEIGKDVRDVKVGFAKRSKSKRGS